MKTSKRSLIVAIAVLCVCALSLTAASYAWFSAVNTAQVTNMNLMVTSSSDLKIAITDATSAANIESTAWGSTFTGTQIAAAQNTYVETAIADATYDEGFKIPADLTAVAADGSYTGELTAAAAGVDYVKCTVYFRSTEKDKVVKMSSSGLSITSANQNLLPALTLRVDGDEVTTKAGSGAIDQNVCTCSTAVVSGTTGATYYVGQADFYIYVDGESTYAVNANSGVNFKLGDVSFAYAA